jgi:hypothetical protein
MSLHAKNAVGWICLCLIVALVGAGTYASGLAILPAVAAAYVLLQRRLDGSALILGGSGLVIIVSYIILAQGTQQLAGGPQLTGSDLLRAFQMWIALTGNAVLNPVTPSLQPLTYALGVAILVTQLIGITYTLRQPAAARHAFMVPVALTLYNFIVFMEILFARFDYPSPGFTPRYSILMLAGPLSALIFLIALVEWSRWSRIFGVTVLGLLLTGTVVADAQTLTQLPYVVKSFERVRLDVLAVKAPPDDATMTEMFMNPALSPAVYTGVLFLREEHLALYRKVPNPVDDPSRPQSDQHAK